jgi:hypothetical protein
MVSLSSAQRIDPSPPRWTRPRVPGPFATLLFPADMSAAHAADEVRLRDVRPSGRARPIAAPMHPIVQVLQFLFERFSVGLPCHAIDSRRSIPRERRLRYNHRMWRHYIAAPAFRGSRI